MSCHLVRATNCSPSVTNALRQFTQAGDLHAPRGGDRDVPHTSQLTSTLARLEKEVSELRKEVKHTSGRLSDVTGTLNEELFARIFHSTDGVAVEQSVKVKVSGRGRRRKRGPMKVELDFVLTLRKRMKLSDLLRAEEVWPEEEIWIDERDVIVVETTRTAESATEVAKQHQAARWQGVRQALTKVPGMGNVLDLWICAYNGEAANPSRGWPDWTQKKGQVFAYVRKDACVRGSTRPR